MDLPQLGDGPEAPQALDESRTATPSKYTEYQRGVRMEATRRFRGKNPEAVRAKDREAKRKMRLDPIRRENEISLARNWRSENRDHLLNYNREYVNKNRKQIKANAKKRNALKTEEQKEADRLKQRLYQQANAARYREHNKKWRAKNPVKLADLHKKYLPRRLALKKLRYHTDPIEKIKAVCRTRVQWILKHAGVPKCNRTFELVGCSPDFLKCFLENQFKDGMTWENHGSYWELDHIIPLSSFDLRVESQLKNAFHYSNCQPLLKFLNRSKNNSLPSPHQALLL